ncbi:MAG: YraN family protein [Planctomycetes bacterium]|nr:YraN family protein [Planctomycetota bacterium]MBI3835521.1 YraN family protein [Planctomycetota bacterium]
MLTSRSWPGRRPESKSRFGEKGERIAEKHLRRKRLRILARNFHCVAGEIDLIARDRDTIVFVEVKTRSSEQAFSPDFNISPFQRGQIERAARYFLMERSAQHRPCRFDIVAVVNPPTGPTRVEHFENAFTPHIHA